jgi:hypothetical protein
MHYPGKTDQNFHENKIGFSVLASVLMNLLKKQRDAIGLSVFRYLEYYAPEKAVIVITEWC